MLAEMLSFPSYQFPTLRISERSSLDLPIMPQEAPGHNSGGEPPGVPDEQPDRRRDRQG